MTPRNDLLMIFTVIAPCPPSRGGRGEAKQSQKSRFQTDLMGLTRKLESKSAALIEGTFDVNAAFEGFGVGLDKAEAQTRAAL